MSKEFIVDNNKCTGCMACYNACNRNGITFEQNDEGFLYPQKNSNCTDCGACKRVCPIINQKDISWFNQEAYAVCTNNRELWRESSSGGAFSEICRAWDDDSEDSIFYGAAWDGLNVIHKPIVGYANIAPLRKSKYIESNIGYTYKNIKGQLIEGKHVLFSGTPCQVAGLKAFLGKEYDNLLLVDIICHGVGSAKVFRSCSDEIEKQFKKSVKSYSFRHKNRAFTQDHIELVTFDDGSTVQLENDPYIQLFTSQKCLRKSCGANCIYRFIRRQGDVTIGDFKHLLDVFPNMKGYKYNFSTIVINSSKGKAVMETIKDKAKSYSCELNDIKKYNPTIYTHTIIAEDRDDFFNDYIKDPQLAIRTRTKESRVYKQNIKGKIFDILPRFLRARYEK